MARYKAVVTYDGTSYHGWQVQKDLPTVAQQLQDTYGAVFGTPTTVLGVSRTDAGVHAAHQVIMFDTHLVVQDERLLWAWNNKLPSTIAITSLEKVAHNYSIYENIAYKTYRYTVFLDRPHPWVARYGWHYRKHIDVAKLQEVLNVFVGTHDFRSFCTGDERENTIRTVDTIQVNLEGNVLYITTQGKTFLRYMIRRIVGAGLMAASTPSITSDMVRKILLKQDPCHPLPKAPAQGLTLLYVAYTMQNKKHT